MRKSDCVLDGKVAMVTGAARGIGEAIAMELAAAGADVSLCDLRVEDLARVRAGVTALSRRVLPAAVDVSRAEQVEQWVARTQEYFGKIDILVNNAGIIETVPFLEIALDSWDRMLAVNLKGTFLCSQAVARGMVQRKTGKIINIASIAGRTGRSLAAHYAASKAAIISLSRSMALALAEYNITVNAVCPGITATPMWDQLDEEKTRLFKLAKGEAFQQAVKEIPMGRAAHPDEIAEVVLFLCSPGAGYITGQAINVCGGLERD
jgi:meso-butanediol dehydrogenase/(S,S)-butanediol dehydrogenase/diacetyl reductase